MPREVAGRHPQGGREVAAEPSDAGEDDGHEEEGAQDQHDGADGHGELPAGLEAQQGRHAREAGGAGGTQHDQGAEQGEHDPGRQDDQARAG